MRIDISTAPRMICLLIVGAVVDVDVVVVDVAAALVDMIGLID
jgi:hypothetical protein